ncbi:MAG: GMC family oxidoreductase [Phycisphaerales bacterium]|nr:GMC family oxidoreductase [Phycisphaerales bacterium]
MAEYDADVIVIGAGGLGAVVALQAAKAGKSVIMLEAGPEIPNWKVIQNWRSSPRKDNFVAPYGDYPWAPNSYTKGYLDKDIDTLRWPGTVRAVGGTSRHWTGITWRFLPEDFKLQSTHGVGRDWPIGYDDLEPFYTEAEYFIGVSGMDSDDQSGKHAGLAYPHRSKPYPMSPEAKPYSVQRLQMRLAPMGMRIIHAPCARASRNYDGRPACIGNNLCQQPECPIGAKFSGEMAVEKARAAGVKLRSEVVVDTLKKDGSGKITSLSYQTRDGVRQTLKAKTYVIAGHALETPKLLLMNELANRSGQLGRNLMVHPGFASFFEVDEPLWQGRGQYNHAIMVNWRSGDHRKESAAFTMSPWNVNKTADLTNILLQSKLIGSKLDAAIPEAVGRTVMMLSILEDLANPDNGVSLNPNWKDALGLPGLHFKYRVADYTKACLPNIFNDSANIAQAMGVKKAPMLEYFITHGHLMGTVMMGDDPSNSVVDRNLRCHDHENLFLVTTGVYPSSTAVNPTLTGYALAFRAGHYIAAEV